MSDHCSFRRPSWTSGDPEASGPSLGQVLDPPLRSYPVSYISMGIWTWRFFEWGELGQSRENWDALSQFSLNRHFYFECFLHKMYSEDIRNTLAYLRQSSLTPDAKRPYRSLHWMNGKQDYSVTQRNRFFLLHLDIKAAGDRERKPCFFWSVGQILKLSYFSRGPTLPTLHYLVSFETRWTLFGPRYSD